MKARLLSCLVLLITITSTIHAQSFGELNINNVRARFYANGLISMDPSDDTPNFEIPNGAGTHPLFSAGLWMGGLSPDNQLKLAAIKYEGLGEGDWYTGPLTNTGDATVDANTMVAFDNVWTVNTADVIEYENYCACLADPGCDEGALFPGYVMPSYFNDWPAIGDVGGGYDLYLAPFNDYNGDGNYQPNDCDAPCAPGDQSLFFIFNDKGGPHLGSGGAPIGLEVRARPFAYSGPNAALANTVFVEYRIANQGTQTLNNAYLGLFADFDLGCPDDDYIGCDVKRSMFYAYNADSNDEDCLGLSGYGTSPPAFGALVLCGPFPDYDNVDWVGIDSLACAINGHGSNDSIIDNEHFGLSRFMSFDRSNGIMGDPAIAQHYYNYMRGIWKDNTPLTYGGNGYGGITNTRYAYPHDSDPFGIGTGTPQPPWSEVSAANTPGDRRGMGSMGPFTLEPGAINRVFVAFTYARASGGGMASVTALQNRADSIREFADSQDFCGGFRGDYPCLGMATGIENVAVESQALQLFPVPSNDHVRLTVSRELAGTELIIYDATGRAAAKQLLTFGLNEVDVRSLANGIYDCQVRTAKARYTGRLIKQ